MTASCNDSSTNEAARIVVAVSTMLLNAGETTRAVEICKALRERVTAADNVVVDITFFSSMYCQDKSISYDHVVEEAGFVVELIGPGYTSKQRQTIFDREHVYAEFYQGQEEKQRVVEAILDTQQALVRYSPDIVLYGFAYDQAAQVASKILDIPSVFYSPMPLDRRWVDENMFDDIPYEMRRKGFWLLPKPIRAMMARNISNNPKHPISQPTVRAAAIEAGWAVQRGGGTVRDMLSADLILVNDLPGNFEEGYEFSSSTIITGPVFPHNDDSPAVAELLDPEILRVFEANNSSKVFIAMGSSGDKEHLLQAIRAVSRPSRDGTIYHVVALVPPTLCSLDEVRLELFGGDASKVPPNIFLTNRFVPAKAVNKLADVAIIHGGQGTVQTSMGSGTPVVAVGLQFEQILNLRNVERRGAGIRLEKEQWRGERIGKAVERVLTHASYQQCAKAVKKEMGLHDGSVESADVCWMQTKKIPHTSLDEELHFVYTSTFDTSMDAINFLVGLPTTITKTGAGQNLATEIVEAKSPSQDLKTGRPGKTLLALRPPQAAEEGAAAQKARGGHAGLSRRYRHHRCGRSRNSRRNHRSSIKPGDRGKE